MTQGEFALVMGLLGVGMTLAVLLLLQLLRPWTGPNKPPVRSPPAGANPFYLQRRFRPCANCGEPAVMHGMIGSECRAGGTRYLALFEGEA